MSDAMKPCESCPCPESPCPDCSHRDTNEGNIQHSTPNAQHRTEGRLFTIQDAAEFLEQTLDVLDRVAGDASHHPERRKLAANILSDFKAFVENRTKNL